mgnify:CR=1 FL=1
MEHIGKRINKMVQVAGLSVSNFASKTNNKQKNLSNVILGRNRPSFEVLHNLCMYAPIIRGLENINSRWVITGEGEMFADHDKMKAIQDQLKQKLEKQNQQVNILKKELETLKSQLKDKEEIIRLQNELMKEYKERYEKYESKNR